MFNLNEPIAAMASAPGSAAGGIVRTSGVDIKPLLNQLIAFDDPQKWQSAKRASTFTGHISLTNFNVPLPVTLYFWNSNRSYTGQPMAEIHTFGSPVLLESLLTELYQHRFRPARPGEFTMRAFLAGRIDLIQAEAVLGVIDAEDHIELNTALQQLAGGISTKIAVVQNDLIDLLSNLEAGLDFVEEDIEFVSRAQLLQQLQSATTQLQQLYEQSQSRMKVSTQKKVVLAGLPNAGKSSLFNRLVENEAAIVSEISGTTRDYLSAEVRWQGVDIELIDTAGWDEDVTGIDKIAQAQRAEQFNRADLLLWCLAVDNDQSIPDDNKWQTDIKKQVPCPILFIQTKQDLLPDINNLYATNFDASLSTISGAGIDQLISTVIGHFSSTESGNKHFAGSTAARCRESLASAVAALHLATETARTEMGDEMIAIELRTVLEHLGHILGTVYTDDILDRIFSKFCIGK